MLLDFIENLINNFSLSRLNNFCKKFSSKWNSNRRKLFPHHLRKFLCSRCDWQFSFQCWSQVYYQSLSFTSVMHERANECEIKRFSIALKSSHEKGKKILDEINLNLDLNFKFILKCEYCTEGAKMREIFLESMHIAMLIINYSQVLLSNYRI